VSANLLCNGIGTEQAAVLAAVVKEHGTLVSVCGLRGSETTVDMSGQGLGAEDVVLLAGELATSGAILSMKLGNNAIGGLVSAGGWKYNPNVSHWQYTHLDGRRPHSKPEGGDFKQLGVLSLGDALQCNAGMTELDLSGTGLGAAGAAVVAGFLPRCEVLTKINLSGNDIFGTHVPPNNSKYERYDLVCERYDFDASAVSVLVNACRLATLQQLELANNNMNARAAQQLGDGLRLLKEAGTLGSALRCIKLHDNPLAHGDQDREGRGYIYSYDKSYNVNSSHESMVASSWERSIDGLQSLLKFVRGSAPLELADMNEEAILKDLEEGRWRGQ
jgi:hypothetical protein